MKLTRRVLLHNAPRITPPIESLTMVRPAFPDAEFWEMKDASPKSPFSRPAWRVKRCHLARIYPRKRLNDRWCERLMACWQQIARAPSINDRPDGPVLMAISIRYGDPLVRGEIEARLVADQAFDQIADKVGWPVEAIVAFEALFFEVSSRRTVKSWLLHSAVVLKPVDATRNHECGYFWKLIAFQFGLVTLEPLLSAENLALVRRFGLRGYLRPECTLDQPIKIRVMRALTPQDHSIEGKCQTIQLGMLTRELHDLDEQVHLLKSIRGDG